MYFLQLKATFIVKKVIFFIVLLVVANYSLKAAITLPKLVSDGMVLQRTTKANIWEWAAANETITIHFNNKIYTTITGKDGKWLVQLNAQKAGGSYTIEIDGSNHITIKNILMGDVWICSGQSNMELPMERVKSKYLDIITNCTNENIRQFNIDTKYNFQQPQDDLPTGNWQSANPQSVLQFTAVGYFFAKSLYEKYHVPIGIIKSCVGGSPAEAWLSENVLKQFPSYWEIAQKFKDNNFIDSIKKADNNVNNNWYDNIYKNHISLHENKKWFEKDYDASAWQNLTVPGLWEDQGLKKTNGIVWIRKETVIPKSMIDKPTTLFLGCIVDRDSVYVNGQFVGTTGYQYPPRKYNIPSGILKAGKNNIIIRVINYSSLGGFVLNKPYQLTTSETVIDLKAKWQYKLGTASVPIAATTTLHYQPASLYNVMIAPFLNYAIKGVIWYKGESNAGRAKEYKTLFPAVINNWRSNFKQGDFPFLHVQLANFMAVQTQPSESNWAELREAQLQTLSVSNTGMAVITDIGEWNDIHPLNKEDVGKRLALAAEKIAYEEKKIVYSAPIYQSTKTEGNKIIISFKNIGGGLVTKGSDTLKHFAIAGLDKKFVWANAKIVGNTVVVWKNAITNPIAVRYAWADNPQSANLYN